MASNYTTNYELPIWAAGDAFLREEFNDANQKIDGALAGKADTEAVAEIKAQMGGKAKIVAGTYSGDNQTSRIITLGFTPKAVMIWTSAGRQEYGNSAYGGLALLDHPCNGLFSIVENGFQVYESDYKHGNSSPYQYYYLAIE